jgi:hypothetical protein
MTKQEFTITCTNCKGKSRVVVKDEKFIEYIDETPIISARYRKDLKWGFECICGNDTRLCKEELFDSEAQVKVKGSSQATVEAVIDRMKQSSEDSFIME